MLLVILSSPFTEHSGTAQRWGRTLATHDQKAADAFIQVTLILQPTYVPAWYWELA